MCVFESVSVCLYMCGKVQYQQEVEGGYINVELRYSSAHTEHCISRATPSLNPGI